MNGRLSKIRSVHTYGAMKIHVFTRQCSLFFDMLKNYIQLELDNRKFFSVEKKILGAPNEMSHQKFLLMLC